MTTLLKVLMWLGAIGFTAGALAESVPLMAIPGIIGALAGTIWGCRLACEEPQRWRWNGEDYWNDPEGYGFDGEVTDDDGKTWRPEGQEIEQAPVWPREVGAPE